MRRLGTLAVAFTLLIAAPASAADDQRDEHRRLRGTVRTDGSCTGIRSALAVAARLTGPDTIIVAAGTHHSYQGNVADATSSTSDVTIRGSGGSAYERDREAEMRRVFNVIGGVTATLAGLTMVERQRRAPTMGGNLLERRRQRRLDHVRVTGGVPPGRRHRERERHDDDPVEPDRRQRLEDAEAAGGAGILNLGNFARRPSRSGTRRSPGMTRTWYGGGSCRPHQAWRRPPTTLERTTVARNSSSSGTGGLVVDGAGTFTVRQSIVDDNTTVPASGPAVESNCGSAAIASGGGNIAGTAPIGTPQCAFAAGAMPLALDPLLSAALVNAGGQTDVLTIAPNSPAINRAGACTRCRPAGSAPASGRGV